MKEYQVGVNSLTNHLTDDLDNQIRYTDLSKMFLEDALVYNDIKELEQLSEWSDRFVKGSPQILFVQYLNLLDAIPNLNQSFTVEQPLFFYRDLSNKEIVTYTVKRKILDKDLTSLKEKEDPLNFTFTRIKGQLKILDIELAIDLDHDFFDDIHLDQCLDSKGTLTAQGCPDTDYDSIPDMEDTCPNLKGEKQHEGCPDTDGDGFYDHDDNCPEQKGTANGCPDADGDGIKDSIDDCPNLKGEPQFSGCLDSTKVAIKGVEKRLENQKHNPTIEQLDHLMEAYSPQRFYQLGMAKKDTLKFKADHAWAILQKAEKYYSKIKKPYKYKRRRVSSGMGPRRKSSWKKVKVEVAISKKEKKKYDQALTIKTKAQKDFTNAKMEYEAFIDSPDLFDRALHYDPNYVDAYVQKALFENYKHNYRKSLRYLNKAAKLSDYSADIMDLIESTNATKLRLFVALEFFTPTLNLVSIDNDLLGTRKYGFFGFNYLNLGVSNSSYNLSFNITDFFGTNSRNDFSRNYTVQTRGKTESRTEHFDEVNDTLGIRLNDGSLVSLKFRMDLFDVCNIPSFKGLSPYIIAQAGLGDYNLSWYEVNADQRLLEKKEFWQFNLGLGVEWENLYNKEFSFYIEVLPITIVGIFDNPNEAFKYGTSNFSFRSSFNLGFRVHFITDKHRYTDKIWVPQTQ